MSFTSARVPSADKIERWEDRETSKTTTTLYPESAACYLFYLLRISIVPFGRFVAVFFVGASPQPPCFSHQLTLAVVAADCSPRDVLHRSPPLLCSGVRRGSSTKTTSDRTPWPSQSPALLCSGVRRGYSMKMTSDRTPSPSRLSVWRGIAGVACSSPSAWPVSSPLQTGLEPGRPSLGSAWSPPADAWTQPPSGSGAGYSPPAA